jgi:AcrR family transcriptional regulator
MVNIDDTLKMRRKAKYWRVRRNCRKQVIGYRYLSATPDAQVASLLNGVIMSDALWWSPVQTSRFRSEVINLGKRSRTRALLMDAAVTVFAERGIEAASISEITATAGVSNGIFYYHFKSKAELLDVVGHAIAAALVNEVDDAIRGIDNGVERVALATQEFIRRAAAEREWGWLIVEALGDLGTFHDQISRGVRKDVAIGIAQGGFTVEPSDLMFASLLSVVSVALRERLQHPKAPDVEGRAAQFVLRMLGIPVAEALRLTKLVQKRRESQQPSVQQSDFRSQRRAVSPHLKGGRLARRP